MIELHSTPTPNGQKVMIMLEETGLPWTHVDVSIMTGEQFTPAHLKLSPNNKIPALVDDAGPGGSRYTMMESGAILVYLAEKTGRFLPADPRKRFDVLQWLFFQVAHVGPMFGQANHFNHLAQVIPYARDRYHNESLRIFRVMENRLAESAWLGCDEYSIADMAIYPWCRGYEKRGVDGAVFPNFLRWFQAMEARPAVQRNHAMTDEIYARMKKAAEGKPPINLYDNKQSAARLAQSRTG